MSAISSETEQPSNSFTPADIIKAISTPRAKIDVWSHGCRISNYGAEIRTLMIDLCRDVWGEYGLVRVGRFKSVSKLKRVYVGTNTDRSVFHFHRNQLDYIVNRLQKINVNKERIEFVHHDLYEPVRVEHPLNDDRPPRQIQIPIIDYLTSPPDPLYAPSKVVSLQTGMGKTFLSLFSLRKIGTRAAIVIQGRYVEKWIGDIEEAYGTQEGAIMVVRGIPQLRSVMELAREGSFKPNVLIISSKTMQMYLDHYEAYGVDDYLPIAPTDLYRQLGIGVRLIDEVHQGFHCNFRQDLYCHVPLTISLSATLEPEQRFVEGLYRILWPVGTWAPEMEYDKFIDVIALWYSFKNIAGIRWLNFFRQYTHVEFEKSILKKPDVLRNYLEMIVDITQKAFIEKMERGQKMIIFVATIQMATLLSDMLSNQYPNLSINRYISEDKFEDLLSADISVSTLQSAGTAIDIPNLRITLMTTALSKKEANIQALGRTRKLRDWPNVTPEFYFLSSYDIDKHRQYAKEKREKLKGKVLSFRDLRTNYVI